MVARRGWWVVLVCLALGSCGGSEAEDSTATASTSTSTASTTQARTSTDDTGDATETGAEPEPGPRWLATWGVAPTAANPLTAPPFAIEDQSLRQVARISVGGDEVRVRLVHTFGELDVAVSEARLALTGEGSATLPGSDRQLSVEGSPSFTLPAGGAVWTDPVELELPALSSVSVSLYFGESALTTTVHAEAHHRAWLGPGNLAAALAWPIDAPSTTSSYWLNGIEVMAPSEAKAIVALGDSITDGSGSTIDASRRWPDRLAERLQANAETRDVAVVNAGIGGNCLLRDFIGPRALDRYDRDVLDQPGVGWVIVVEGINDIGVASIFGPELSAEQLTAGYEELIARGHERGLLVYGGTLLPFEGSEYYTEAGEQIREAVNEWIRTRGAFDSVIDFDAVTRDPAAPTKLLEAYDAGDHLHLNDAGYAAMGDAIDLGLFE